MEKFGGSGGESAAGVAKSFAEEAAERDVRGDLTEDEYDRLAMASILLIRLGTHTPRQAYEAQMRARVGRAAPPTRRKQARLRTVKGILREIERTTIAISDGSIEAKQGRTVLYGLRTLLAAKKAEGG